MAASRNLHQPQEETKHQPIIGEYGYPLQGQGASAHYPLSPVEDYLPQGYPPEADLPPVYPAIEQGPPPAYDSVSQLAYNYQPQLAKTTTLVTTQPTTTTTIGLSLPEENHIGIAICALVFSICTLIVCGASVIYLSLSVPALILSIAALKTRGRSQRGNASFSICLNVVVVVTTVMLLVAVVTPGTVTASTRSCSPYYSTTYRTYCLPHSSTTRGNCTYYAGHTFSRYYRRRNYCPST